MSSELVFSATRSIANRYLLCRLTARTVRTLHFASSNTQDAITDALVRIGAQPGEVASPAAAAHGGTMPRAESARNAA